MQTLTKSSRLPRILVVDDSFEDIRFFRDAFARQHGAVQIDAAENGLLALEWLRSRLQAKPAELPDLILLDLNMPQLDGREFLEIIKSDARLSRIPVVVLTNSASDVDVTRAYKSHANGYLVKPSDLGALNELIQIIDHYWLRANISPSPI